MDYLDIIALDRAERDYLDPDYFYYGCVKKNKGDRYYGLPFDFEESKDDSESV